MEVDTNLIDEFKALTKEDAEFSKKCTKLAQDIISNQTSILTLVEQLGPLLIDPQAQIRALGTWILTNVLETLPPEFLDSKQLEFICAFYADRLKDNHQVIPAVLAGILALSKNKNFPEKATVQLLKALFLNVACQQQQDKDRYNIYRIFQSFLEKKATEIMSMGLEFVYGVIQAVDSERNPKNLLFLFHWFPKFLKTVSLGHLSEEVFEILACYFPVDFKAPNSNFTREQLANSLAPCLTAIPEFAEFCFPLALEKLDSSLEIAKLDSLKLLEIGCSTFDASSYLQNVTEIWSQIQKTVFNNADKKILDACLKTLKCVIKKISNSFGTTVKDIIDTLKGNLIPDSKLFGASSKMLLSVAEASKTSSDLVIKEIVPILINTYNITNTNKIKAKILEELVKYFLCYVKFHDSIEFEELKRVPIFCLKATQQEELKKVGFYGLKQLVQFLPAEIRNSIYENLESLLLTPQNEAKTEILHCFKELAKFFPEEIQTLLHKIQTINNDVMLDSYLNALTVIVPQEYFTEIVINILLNYLNAPNNLGSIVINVLNKILQNQSENKIYEILNNKNIIKILIDWSLINEATLDLNILSEVASILKLIVAKQSLEEQNTVIKDVNLELSPKRVFIFVGVLTTIKKEAQIDYNILNQLTILALKENQIKTTTAQLIANIINKCGNENVILKYLSQFDSNKIDLTLMTWITKALVMRNHQLANKWTNDLIERLQGEEEAAKSFGIIINDSFDCLSEKSNSNKTFLYQQKFFTIVSNKLSENCQCTSYLLALGYMIEAAPKQVVLLQFNKILKALIFILDQCEDVNILFVVLNTLKSFIVSKEKCVDDHLSDFLTRFLKLSTFDKSMKIRILALQCLQECVFAFPTYKLLHHKQEVLIKLAKAVDDRKRIVRKEAVEARSLWFTFDAPI